MAEYWKSQPKKFCDFCKCWIADNKASVDFHENGKKHQENVKLRIQEVKKKGAERRQQQEQLHDDLAAIEAAALKAYKKDIGFSNCPQPNDLKSETTSKHEHTAEGNCVAENNDESRYWAAYQTPEGYWYYFNNQTGESRWDPPEGFSSSGQQQNQYASSSEQNSGEQSNEVAIRNDDVTDQSNEEHKQRSSPFGKWETVAVYDRNDETKHEGTEKLDRQDQVPTVKFKEKQLPVTNKSDSNDTNVTFKKRKNNQDKKRSIRQRTDES